MAAGSKTTQLLAAAVGGPSWVIKTLRFTALEKAKEGKTPSAQDKRGSQPGDSKHRHGKIIMSPACFRLSFQIKVTTNVILSPEFFQGKTKLKDN